jgi:hypothetical protein
MMRPRHFRLNTRATAYDDNGCELRSRHRTSKYAFSPSSSPSWPQARRPVRRAGGNTRTRTRVLRSPFRPSPSQNHVVPSPPRSLGRCAHLFRCAEDSRISRKRSSQRLLDRISIRSNPTLGVTPMLVDACRGHPRGRSWIKTWMAGTSPGHDSQVFGCDRNPV